MTSFNFKHTSSTIAAMFLLLLLLPASVATSTSTTPRHHRTRSHRRTRMVACNSYLSNRLHFPPKAHMKKPSKACCSRYLQIFNSGDPTSLCLYMQPEKLKTSINGNRLLSLHDLCSGPVPLYDICVGIDYAGATFNGIEGVLTHGNRMIQHGRTPFKKV